MKSFGFIIFAQMFWLAGCVVPPPPDRSGENGVGQPQVWTGAKVAIGEPDTAWVRRFHCPELESLVAEALLNNPDLRVTAAKLEQARAISKSARAERGPKFDINVNGSKRKQNFLGFPFGNDGGTGGARNIAGNTTDSFNASLDVQWELDLWGRIRAGESAAVAGVEAAQAEVAGARASLAAEVCKAWFSLAEVDEQQRLAEESVRITQDTVRTIRERFESGQADGRGTGTDLRLAMSESSSAAAELDSTRRFCDQALRRLELSLGRYPSASIRVGVYLPDPAGSPPAGLPGALIMRRPDLRAAERRFAAQGARLKEARLAVFPNIRLTGSNGYSSDELANLLESDFGVWNLAGGIVQPIFYSGQIQAEKSKRAAEEREAQAVFQRAVLNAFGEVEQALAADAILVSRQKHLTEAVRLAEEADVEARADYRDGRGDALVVFNAQTRLIQSRRQLATARLVRLENRVNLHLALGGDFRL